MGINSFPIVSGAQVTPGGDTTAKHEPGTVLAYRSGTDQWSLVQYVQAGNNVIGRYLACVTNHATLKQYSVRLPATADGGAPIRGIALATIASQCFGYVAIAGYVEYAYQSFTAASGEYLQLSASTAGQLSAYRASTYFQVIQSGHLGTTPVVVAVAKGAMATTATVAGSVQLIGIWS